MWPADLAGPRPGGARRRGGRDRPHGRQPRPQPAGRLDRAAPPAGSSRWASSSASSRPSPDRSPNGWPPPRSRPGCPSPTRACGCATTSTPSTATTSTCTPRRRRSSASRPGRWPRRCTRSPSGSAGPDDYEAVLAPLYAWMFAMAQRSKAGVARAGSRSSVRAWDAAGGTGAPAAAGPRARAHRRAADGGRRPQPRGHRAAGRASCPGRRCAAAPSRASREVLAPPRRRRAATSLFGHTHRAGPWPQDDAAEWRTPARDAAGQHRQLGLPAPLPAGAPGRRPLLAGDGDRRRGRTARRRLERLLADRTHEDLRPAPGPA